MKHPPQREMWEGLTGPGCLGTLLIIMLIAIALEAFLN